MPNHPIEALIEAMHALAGRGHTVRRVTLPSRPARTANLLDLPEPLRRALARQGVRGLYTHQAAAFTRARAGAHVGLVTPAASGKTLAYLLPVLDALHADPRATALYLAPLKALAQDQREEIASWLDAAGLDAAASIYDGDTPEAERAALRRRAPAVLLTNPDMLHAGLLPRHQDWRSFFARLRYVILDEVHVYRGVFGSHVAQVLRRLRRVCRAHGGDPRFLCCSATIGEPGAFLRALLGFDVEVIADSGAPAGLRHLLFWTPAASPYTEAVTLMTAALERDLKTIAFTKSRKMTELLARWLQDQAPALAPRVSAYRAGYLPEERREIERRLFRDDLLGVISTSALELGIDVGGLDVCLLVGYPGTAAAFWQRSGRAGRGARPALTVFIGLDDALDAYLLEHPEELLGAPLETAQLAPDNPKVMAAHLVCAAAEWPLAQEDGALFGPTFPDRVAELVREGRLAAPGGRGQGRPAPMWFSRLKTPHRQVGLRSSGRTFAILQEDGALLGTLDAPRVYQECHPQAVYLHRGARYEVTALDEAGRTVSVRPSDPPYFTEALTAHEVEVLAEEAARPFAAAPLTAHRGRVRVTEQVVGFLRRKLPGRERMGEAALELPPCVFDTEALWLSLPPDWLDTLAPPGPLLSQAGGLHAAEHAMIALLPLLAMCDRWDLGGLSTLHHPATGGPVIFVHEAHEGGVGLTRRGFEVLDGWLERTLALLTACPCELGCPRCVQSPKCGNGNRPLDKTFARLLLEAALGRPDYLWGVPLSKGRT